MTITIDPARLPSFEDLSTAHWSAEQQSQFSKAVTGIKSAEWFQALTKDAGGFEGERLASAFAFACFSHLRNRLRLAPEEELMQDNKGRAASAAPLKSQGLSPEAALLLTGIEHIYRYLGPAVPPCVEDTEAAYEWRHALNTAKHLMGDFKSDAFYEEDSPPENAESFSITEHIAKARALT
jgi:hypothetical protein